MSEVTTVRLATTGMHCGSCAMLIDMTLEDIAGVSAVSTDYATRMTEVSFDASVVSIDDIIVAVRAVGYDAEAV